MLWAAMFESRRGFEPKMMGQEIKCCSICKLRFIRNWAYLGCSLRMIFRRCHGWLDTPSVSFGFALLLSGWTMVAPCCGRLKHVLALRAFTYLLPVWYRNLWLRNWPSLGPGVTGGRDSGGSDEAGMVELIWWGYAKRNVHRPWPCSCRFLNSNHFLTASSSFRFSWQIWMHPMLVWHSGRC